MKAYLAASLGAAAAASTVALGAAVLDGAAVDLALSGAAPSVPAGSVARRAEPRWLLRVMTEAASPGTLCPLPGTAPAESDSL